MKNLRQPDKLKTMAKEIKTVHLEDKNYPQLLKTIPYPAKTLYYRGEIKEKEACLAIVGARDYSSYGKNVALKITTDLLKENLTIVSGLALGIDTFVQRVIVQNKKRTIAVLGTGLDNKSIYPQENVSLVEEILKEGGTLISEYPPGTPASKTSFPQRNRIISGLSLATLIIEAKKNSGSMITARWAKKQKRKIFVIPGSIYSANSKGCHQLIKEGHQLVETAEEIVQKLKPELYSYKNKS